MPHASPVSFLRVSFAAGIGFAAMVTAAACGSNSTLPSNAFGSSSGGSSGGNSPDATASSSGGGNGSSGSNYNNPSNGGSTNSSSGSTSSGGGTMCVAQCHADSDCQSSCPAPAMGTSCCDQSSNTCFMSPNAQCTPSQVGSE